MGANRVFFPQQALDRWLDQGYAALAGDDLFIAAGGRHFRLQGALLFLADVAETGDPHALVGKVKTLDVVGELQGEHCADSVILGESAYQVVEGFLGEPLPSAVQAPAPVLKARAASADPSDLDTLAQLLERLESG